MEFIKLDYELGEMYVRASDVIGFASDGKGGTVIRFRQDARRDWVVKQSPQQVMALLEASGQV